MQLKVFTNGLVWLLTFGLVPILGMVVFAVHNSVRGRPSSERVRQAGGSVFLNQWVMEYGYWWLSLPARALIRLNISPNTVTMVGLAIVAFGSVMAGLGYFGLAGPVILIGSLADMLDGVIARQLNICSDAGEFVDAMVDRYADILMLGGLAVYYGDRPWAAAIVLLALLGSVMVSYARAKAESFNIHDSPGSPMRRAERAVYLGFSMLFAPMVASFTEPPSARPDYYATLAVCAMIGLITNYSAISMTMHATRRLKETRP